MPPVSLETFVPYAFKSLAEMDKSIGVAWMTGRAVPDGALQRLDSAFRREMNKNSGIAFP
jgi:hypothetical protein